MSAAMESSVGDMMIVCCISGQSRFTLSDCMSLSHSWLWFGICWLNLVVAATADCIQSGCLSVAEIVWETVAFCDSSLSLPSESKWGHIDCGVSCLKWDTWCVRIDDFYILFYL